MTQAEIDGPALIQALLSTEDLMLRSVPSTLAVRFPQHLRDDDDLLGEEDAWIQPEDADSYRPVTWKGERVDLRACCSPGCVGAENAVYRLRAFVHYCRRGNVPGPRISDEGHFTAHFRSGETWYAADDLDPDAIVRKESACPTEYPYICFLERVGDPETQPESISSHEVRSTDDAQSDEGEDPDGSGEPVIPTKCRRVRCKKAAPQLDPPALHLSLIHI